MPADQQPRMAEPAPNHMPWWAPRFWIGSDARGWFRLLAKNGFRVSPTRAHMALAASFYSLGNSGLRALQELVYGRRIAEFEIPEAPIFVLGHWRCGTTLLHELLILDERHSFPNTWQCFSSNHFLLTERLGKKYLKFILPKQRPMDNMPLDWDLPQEDEFALCNLGVPSPYATILFPNEAPQHQEYLDLKNISPEERERWKQAFLRFLKQVTYVNPRRVVLKSPPHTSRVKALLELFPDARFVHIARDPFVVFPSTMHLWRSLYDTQGFQKPKFAELEEHVFRTFEQMHARYQETRELIAPNRLFETRYEDLLADPVEQMRCLYEKLELGDYAPVRDKIAGYFAEKKSYKTNRYQIAPELERTIRERWGDYIQVYGYSPEPAAV